MSFAALAASGVLTFVRSRVHDYRQQGGLLALDVQIVGGEPGVGKAVIGELHQAGGSKLVEAPATSSRAARRAIRRRTG